jgi:hypothetical protein
MGIFDEQVKLIHQFISTKKNLNQLREFQVNSYRSWLSGSSLILEEGTALELGNPGLGSLSLIMWSWEKGNNKDHVFLVGPDLKEMSRKSMPFCQIIIARGSFRDEYECYRELRDAVFDTKMRGLMVRVLPSRQTIWCRVSREALEEGFSLGHLGAALIRNLKDIEFVSGVDVVFVTSGKSDLKILMEPTHTAGRIAGALVKMGEEMSLDCNSCEYRDVCEQVVELKKIRNRLKEGAAG